MLPHYKKETKFCLLCLNVNDPMIDHKFLYLFFLMIGYKLLASFSLVPSSFYIGGSWSICMIYMPQDFSFYSFIHITELPVLFPLGLWDWVTTCDIKIH